MLKKMFITACCSVVVCLAVTLWIVPQIRAARAEVLPEPVSSEAPVSSEEERSSAPTSSAAGTSASAAYLVTEYEGNVAVFRAGEDKPYQVLDMPLSMLPETDRALLRKGIPVMTEQELASILEDYS